MKNITVSVDEDTHRLARIRAAELDTSVSALVRDYLEGLVSNGASARAAVDAQFAALHKRRYKRLLDVIEDIRVESPDFRVADNLPREELYDRARARAEAQAASSSGKREGG